METISLDDPWVVSLIALYIEGMAPEQALSTVSGEIHRRRLATLCQELYLNHGFRWYSLRRGGATHEFRKSRNLGELLIKGRWNCAKTARIYLQDGVATLSQLVLPPRVKAFLHQLAVTLRPRHPEL